MGMMDTDAKTGAKSDLKNGPINSNSSKQPCLLAKLFEEPAFKNSYPYLDRNINNASGVIDPRLL